METVLVDQTPAVQPLCDVEASVVAGAVKLTFHTSEANGWEATCRAMTMIRDELDWIPQNGPLKCPWCSNTTMTIAPFETPPLRLLYHGSPADAPTGTVQGDSTPVGEAILCLSEVGSTLVVADTEVAPTI